MSFRLENISYQYSDGTVALNNISTNFEKGQRTAILGANGSGKTTLLLHLNGIFRPNSGKIFFEDKPLDYSSKTLLKLRKRIGYVFQDPNDQLFATTVKQDVAFGPLNLGLPVDEVKALVNEALEIVGMKDFADKPPHFLSLGEKKRIALAGVLAMHPEIIIMDEPTSHLDPKTSSEILNLLLKLNRESSITLIMATHDVDMVPLFADKLCILSKSKIIAEGSPNDIFSDTKLIRKVGLRLPRITHLFDLLKNEDNLTIAGKLPLTINQARKEILRILSTSFQNSGTD